MKKPSAPKDNSGFQKMKKKENITSTIGFQLLKFISVVVPISNQPLFLLVVEKMDLKFKRKVKFREISKQINMELLALFWVLPLKTKLECQELVLRVS
jgi:hypothetical protein